MNTALRHRRPTGLVVAALIAVVAMTAPTDTQAQSTVYTSFGPGDDYNTDGSLPFNGPGFATAVGFTYRGPSGLALSTLRFGFFNFNADWTLEASFWEGPSMNSAVRREVWTGITGPSRIVTLTSAEAVALVDGNTYWFTGTTTGGTGLPAGMGYNTVRMRNLVEFDKQPLDGNWELQPDHLTVAWEVNAVPAGTPVPEPSSLALLGAGGLLLAAGSRRRRVAA